MIISKSFKYRLRLTPEQASLCSQTAGSCRYVWNRGLALKKEAWEAGNEKISRFDLDNLLKEWKQEHEWLSISPSQALQQVNKDLDRAFSNFFKGSGYPKFKKKGVNDSFRLPQGIALARKLSGKVARVKLPKLGMVWFTKSREIEGKIKHVTISRTCNRGVAVFAQCSDGKSIPGVSPLKRNLKRLARLQKELSRKKKFSSNWKKTREKIQKLHHHIANVRNDFLHKASTRLAKSHGLIVLEDLKVKNMSRSARGTKKSLGTNVRAKEALNRSIIDQGWYAFQNYLSYKLAWRGAQLVLVPPINTSTECRICHHVAKENRKSRDIFCCVHCGHTENAHVNASVNILVRGLKSCSRGTRGDSLWSGNNGIHGEAGMPNTKASNGISG